MQSRHQHCIRSSRDNNSTEDKVATTPGCRDINCEDLWSRQHQVVTTTSGCRDNIRLSRQQLYRKEVATTPGYRDTSCKDQKVAMSVSCLDVSFNEKRSRQDQVVATPASLKTCHNHTEAPATRTETTTEVATRALCRDSISILG